MAGAIQHKIKSRTLLEPDTVAASIIRALAYFDIFQYPLSRDEIHQFLDHAISEHSLDIHLHELLQEQLVFCYHHFYSLSDNPFPACKRTRSNQRAEILLPKARHVGRFLYQFPFVKAIGISGSLSKNVADGKADFDFFIIANTNRLWIARTLMHCYKKLTYLTGRQHRYCMNYYIDEKALMLEEKNIFIAMEIKTLIPVAGGNTMEKFFAANQWTDKWLPSCPFKKQAQPDPHNSFFKRIVEWICNLAGNSLDNFLMNITQRRWLHKRQNGKRNSKGQRMDLVTSKHFARSNPGSFQEKVLKLYTDKLKEFGV